MLFAEMWTRQARRTTIAVPFLLAFAFLAQAQPVRAHELRPVIATIEFLDGGQFELKLSLNLEAAIAEIGPDHADTSQSKNAREYEHLRSLPAAELGARFEAYAPQLLDAIRLQFDGRRVRPAVRQRSIPEIGDVSLSRVSEVVLEGSQPAPANSMTWELDRVLGDSVIRVRKAESEQIFHSGYIAAGTRSEPITIETAAPQSTWSVSATTSGSDSSTSYPRGWITYFSS
jgi:hypothetical protein